MSNNEFGDFQTPSQLADQCLKVLNMKGDARIYEPTCGLGAFLESASRIVPKSERFGLDINPEYVKHASRWAHVMTGNIFESDLRKLPSWTSEGPLFIVGNPPWVTSAELKRMGSSNLPTKANIKKIKGLDALLGSANFDVCEYIILKVLGEFSQQPFTLGMLCKTQVVRNVIEYASRISLPIARAALYRIDAMRWFGAGVDACWFTETVDLRTSPCYRVEVHEDLFHPDRQSNNSFGMVGSLLVSNLEKYETVRLADGQSPYVWRSGLKHDASSVFELIAHQEPTTKSGKHVDVESDYIFPLLKGTDIFRGRQHQLSKWVIVPQTELNEQTDHLRIDAPKLWRYLNDNAVVLDGRKSSIYKRRPRFSVFGLGPYTFAPYKVAVSGLHKKAVFRLVTPLAGKPVILDDTCYLLPFKDPTEAALVTVILNSQECSDLIESLVFWDSKRPINKKILSRLDLNKLPVNSEAMVNRAAELAHDLGIPFDMGKAKSLVGCLGNDEIKEKPLQLIE